MKRERLRWEWVVCWLGLFPFFFAAQGTAAQLETKIVLIGGPKSHYYMAHEHYASYVVLAKRLEAAGLGIKAIVCKDGWPKDESVLNGAAAVAINCDGGAQLLSGHLAKADELMKCGVGLVVLHYATIIDKGPVADKVLAWVGGYDEPNWSVVQWWTAEFNSLPTHPITRGVKPFSFYDEWYYHMRFRPNMEGVTPILSAIPPDSTREGEYGPHSGNPVVRSQKGAIEVVAWASERPDGVRGFGFTGLHNHWNLAHPQFRKVLLNGIAWCAHVEIPKNGIESSTPTLEELKLNQDEPVPEKFSFDKIRKDMATWARRLNNDRRRANATFIKKRKRKRSEVLFDRHRQSWAYPRPKHCPSHSEHPVGFGL